MGYVSWIGKYETDNSVLVTLLLKAGAVFYVKTSVPQSLMVCETVNNIIGRTVNPRKCFRTPPAGLQMVLTRQKATEIGLVVARPEVRVQWSDFEVVLLGLALILVRLIPRLYRIIC